MDSLSVLKNKPEIRFERFDGAWEERKLGEVVRVLGGNAWKSSNYSDDGEYLVITIANVSGEVFINDSIGNRLSCDSPDIYLLSKGDILVSLTGNVGRVSKMSSIKGLLNQRVGKVFPNSSDIYTDFLFHVLRNPHFERAMIDASQGAAQKNISNDDVLNYVFFLPAEKNEQENIAACFNNLDAIITLQQRKCDRLQALKSAMLVKMFPKAGSDVPEIRFAGFTDAWEQRKVSELFRVTRGYVLAATKTETTKTDEKPYPVYSSQTKDKGLMGYYKDYLYEDAITWTTDGANAGTVNYRAGKFYCTNVCGVLLSNEVKANQMIAEALNRVAKVYVSYVGNPKLMNNVMADIVIQIPTQAEEREQLSSFFAKLDNLITLHQRKLQKLQECKKALLEKMFVDES